MTAVAAKGESEVRTARGGLGRVRNLALYLAACLFVGFALFPLYMIITTSLKTDQQTFAWPPVWIFAPSFHSYYNALFVFGGRGAGHYLLNSLLVTLVSSALAVSLGAMAAYGLARFHFHGNRDTAFYILSTRFAPPVGFIVPIYLMTQRSGLLDTLLALIIVYTSMNLSFVTWIMRGFFLDIPIEIEEAALVDGYTRWQIFLRVAIPLVRPGLSATAILSAIFSWNEFLFASILAPGDAATIPVFLSGFSASMNIEWGEYMAVGTLAVLPIMIFTLVLQRHLVRGLTFGAVR
jgi:multiple sugar transport system permease protein